VEWNDRFANLIHEGHDNLHQLDKSTPGTTGGLTTYVPIFSESYKPGRYRDAVMLQFSSKAAKGTEKPHFLNGDSSHEVNLWWWRADYDPIAKPLVEAQEKRMADALASSASGGKVVTVSQVEVVNLKEGDIIGKEGRAALEMNAKGFKKAFTTQGDDSQALTTNAKFEDGTWTVVFKRPLVTEDIKHDVQFIPGKFIPLVVNAWDGWNKDIGMQKSISTWYFVYLEKPMPAKVYYSSLIAALAIFGVSFQLSRVWRKKA
jgi:DMSO reductase family type II enzyme heme b subunit